ncbi:MAG TPA: 50S ribosomal protein L25 [Euzebyales bacterium]|nr:50S ribosomal protein L25 [Euzebyales bacterium]
MADQVTLTAEARDGRGKGEGRRLRRAGRVPAVAYGADLDATPVSVDALELYHALRTDAGLNALIRLEVGGDTHLTLARQLQRHPVRREIMHVDFVVVDRSRKVTVDVPIHLTGEAAGADEGGVVDQVRFDVPVEVLPLEVPDSLELDISDMGVGDVKRLDDLDLPEGVELLEDPEHAVVSVYIPQVEVPEIEVAEGEELEKALGAEGQPVPADASEAEATEEGGGTGGGRDE